MLAGGKSCKVRTPEGFIRFGAQVAEAGLQVKDCGH